MLLSFLLEHPWDDIGATMLVGLVESPGSTEDTLPCSEAWPQYAAQPAVSHLSSEHRPCLLQDAEVLQDCLCQGQLGSVGEVILAVQKQPPSVTDA